METPELPPSAATLAQRALQATDAAGVADALASSWRGIAEALAPVIGARGVAALYVRSVHLAGSTYPWLEMLPLPARDAMDLDALRALIASRNQADALGGAQALLLTLLELLTSLVGPSLTERLLRSVWANASQDRNP